MIDDYLFGPWDEPPAAMDFELPYGEIVGHAAELVSSLRREGQSAMASQAAALELFVMTPAIINVILNYSVCVQFGLPLHPTEYFEVDAQRPSGPDRMDYGEDMRQAAMKLLDRAIGLARAAYRLDASFGQLAARFRVDLPPGIVGFVYTSRPDKYTWRAADPEKVRALSASILKVGRPQLAVGAAHGSIMAGLLLAEYLSCELWFVRFSMFKRNDREPVVSELDRARMLERGGNDGSGIVLFDEDSASGTTMRIMADSLRRIVPRARTAAVIRHQSASFRPDHVGKVWWD